MLEGVFGMPGLEDVRDHIREEHKLRRLGRPEEIAAAALFLVSRRRVVRDGPGDRRRRRLHRGPRPRRHGHVRVLTLGTGPSIAAVTADFETSRFETMSGVPVDAVYGPADAERPGEYPYTRGPYPDMYRSKLWTMRMFAGFGTAIDTNRRFHELLAAGGDGLSTAFDLPTLMGRDSDDELALGEVGKCGVAVDTLADVDDLYRDIDLGAVTTSMTINGPAAVIFAMFVANAEANGVERARIGGTLQNDILKEYQAQKEFIFPPRPSLRLVRDTIAFCTDEMPRFASDLDLRIPHPRSRFDGRAGARVHGCERLCVRRARVAGRIARRHVRAALVVLLQRARRLLRRDRQVPRRAPHLGALDARPLRRPARTLIADALPYADGRRLVDRAAARGQHRAHRDRGAGRRARGYAEPAHELDGRDARAAVGEGGAHRVAHPAGDRATKPA